MTKQKPRTFGHIFRSVISYSSLSFLQKNNCQTVHEVCTVEGEMLATVKESIDKVGFEPHSSRP